MSLGEFQENMHVGESLPVAGGAGAMLSFPPQ
jgi:hypothetical protein